MEGSRRDRNREATLQEIKTSAWEQIASQGVPGLSLRGIARAMGMTAPGLYRYFASRDDLVTTLIIDAFESFSEYLEAARDEHPADDHNGRFQAICTAYFHWAARNPTRYTIIFGAPVPGYSMTEAVYPHAQRAFLILQGVIGAAQEAGAVHPAFEAASLPFGLLERYQLLNHYGMPYKPLVTHLALMTWSQVHGMCSLYLYGYMHGFLDAQIEAFVQQTIRQLAAQLGLA